MIRCIALDDEPKALEVIKRYCQKLSFLELVEIFRDPLEALNYLSNNDIDLLFLDVNMPHLNGLELLHSLVKKPMVIFSTAYTEYAVDSYRFQAIDYLLKPITFDRFLLAVNKAQELLRLKNKGDISNHFILLRSGSQIHRINIQDILYLEKKGNYLTVITKDLKLLIRENIKDIFSILPEQGFIRVHKSYIVALGHISSIEVHQLTVAKIKIPVGLSYREELMKQLTF